MNDKNDYKKLNNDNINNFSIDDISLYNKKSTSSLSPAIIDRCLNIHLSSKINSVDISKIIPGFKCLDSIIKMLTDGSECGENNYQNEYINNYNNEYHKRNNNEYHIRSFVNETSTLPLFRNIMNILNQNKTTTCNEEFNMLIKNINIIGLLNNKFNYNSIHQTINFYNCYENSEIRRMIKSRNQEITDEEKYFKDKYKDVIDFYFSINFTHKGDNNYKSDNTSNYNIDINSLIYFNNSNSDIEKLYSLQKLSNTDSLTLNDCLIFFESLNMSFCNKFITSIEELKLEFIKAYILDNNNFNNDNTNNNKFNIENTNNNNFNIENINNNNNNIDNNSFNVKNKITPLQTQILNKFITVLKTLKNIQIPKINSNYFKLINFILNNKIDPLKFIEIELKIFLNNLNINDEFLNFYKYGTNAHELQDLILKINKIEKNIEIINKKRINRSLYEIESQLKFFKRIINKLGDDDSSDDIN
ncbi:hypothetical protein DMUE_5766, partial [Dictyocoela muelleri]